MQEISANLLLVWIKGSDTHREELCKRFDRSPKPMYYRPEFLMQVWQEYAALHPGNVDPDAFLRFGYARLLESRQPRYEAMARWGITVTAEEVAEVKTPSDFDQLMARALDRHDPAFTYTA